MLSFGNSFFLDVNGSANTAENRAADEDVLWIKRLCQRRLKNKTAERRNSK
jgi:hypothetical protein